MILCFGTTGWDCSMLWIMMIVVFFFCAIFRKQVAENLLSMDFSLIGSTIVAEVVFVVVKLLSGSPKWAFLAALGGMALGGFTLGPIIGDTSSEGGD